MCPLSTHLIVLYVLSISIVLVELITISIRFIVGISDLPLCLVLSPINCPHYMHLHSLPLFSPLLYLLTYILVVLGGSLRPPSTTQTEKLNAQGLTLIFFNLLFKLSISFHYLSPVYWSASSTCIGKLSL